MDDRINEATARLREGHGLLVDKRFEEARQKLEEGRRLIDEVDGDWARQPAAADIARLDQAVATLKDSLSTLAKMIEGRTP